MRKINNKIIKYDTLFKYKDIFKLYDCYENIKNILPSHYKKFEFLEFYEYFFHTDKILLFLGCHWIFNKNKNEDFLSLIFYKIDLNNQLNNTFDSYEQILANNYIMKTKKYIDNINFSINESLIIDNDSINIDKIKRRIKNIYKY